MLIIRRSNFVNTASGIELLNLHTGRSLTENTVPDAVLMQFDLLMMGKSGSKHVEDYNNECVI